MGENALLCIAVCVFVLMCACMRASMSVPVCVCVKGNPLFMPCCVGGFIDPIALWTQFELKGASVICSKQGSPSFVMRMLLPQKI